MNLRSLASALLLGGCLLPGLTDAEDSAPVPLRLQAVESLKKLAADLGPKLSGRGIQMKIVAGGGAADAVLALGTETADVALTMRPVTGEERSVYPDKVFEEIEVGKQVVTLMVSDFVWQNGVHALSREQVQRIYESKLTNWNELGGPARSIKFYNPVRGQGVWEIFAAWLYGDQMKAGPGRFELVENGELASATVQFNSGALTAANVQWADGKEAHALGIKDEEGMIHDPTNENIVSGKYPLIRPVFVVMAARRLGARREFVEFLGGPEGRGILKKNEFVPILDFNEKAGSGK